MSPRWGCLGRLAACLLGNISGVKEHARLANTMLAAPAGLKNSLGWVPMCGAGAPKPLLGTDLLRSWILHLDNKKHFGLV
jgi:hypothetical protein